MRATRMSLLAGVVLIAACSDAPNPASPDVSARAVGDVRSNNDPGVQIPDRYIVVLKPTGDRAVNVASSIIPAGEGRITASYDVALKGFAADLTPTGVAAVRARSEVSFVEADQVYTANTTQTGATWGLDRIDQNNLPLNGTYVYGGNGTGVNAYIIDTGIRLTHNEFAGRAFSGFTAINDGNGTNDCNGHGTHVSGTVGGTTYGVAKGVKLYAVRVLDCSGSGTTSGVIAGINWVAANRVLPAVVNMSLGGGFSPSLNAAVANAVSKGVTFAVAAGNDGANSCNYSPSSEPSAITVGATSSTDVKASWSNFGSCLDIFAPGVGITSSVNTSNTATAVYSGTSMASPHVAGVAALYLQANPSATPAQVATALTSNATLNKVASPGTNSANRLLFMGFIGGVTPPPPPPAPVAAFTWTCNTQRRCVFDASTSTGTALTYRWTNSNDTPKTGVTAIYWWDISGRAQTVTLTVTDSLGRTNTLSKSVVIY